MNKKRRTRVAKFSVKDLDPPRNIFPTDAVLIDFDELGSRLRLIFGQRQIRKLSAAVEITYALSAFEELFRSLDYKFRLGVNTLIQEVYGDVALKSTGLMKVNLEEAEALERTRYRKFSANICQVISSHECSLDWFHASPIQIHRVANNISLKNDKPTGIVGIVCTPLVLKEFLEQADSLAKNILDSGYPVNLQIPSMEDLTSLENPPSLELGNE